MVACRTPDDVIDGVALTFTDISKRAGAEAAEHDFPAIGRCKIAFNARLIVVKGGRGR
jgi:hypothetical protein